eukprot:gb/GEZN01007980.1/.p1 GENE.gb/GEZN01007980.1/~~gb/GEZN01007980.1/.p1  ORF type:complete len:194 (-),score=24.89 gb/GEZN01007980.1/:792-1373(-)
MMSGFREVSVDDVLNITVRLAALRAADSSPTRRTIEEFAKLQAPAFCRKIVLPPRCRRPQMPSLDIPCNSPRGAKCVAPSSPKESAIQPSKPCTYVLLRPTQMPEPGSDTPPLEPMCLASSIKESTIQPSKSVPTLEVGEVYDGSMSCSSVTSSLSTSQTADDDTESDDDDCFHIMEAENFYTFNFPVCAGEK